MKRFLFSLLFCLLAREAIASPSFDFDTGENKRHVTADRTLYHSKEKVYEAFGHVVISSRGERLSADYVWLDTVNNELQAKGNVIFVNTSSTVQAAEIHYNLVTGMGTIFYGKVSNDLYSLHGELIRRVATDHYLVSEGEYTTCKDCAESWKFAAKNLDLTFDGYAYMSDVYVKVKDVSTLYLPYLVVPVKSRRQTGFLFPKISSGSNHGFAYIQPFFLDIDPHEDATVGLGKYENQGKRVEFEYRYKPHDDTYGYLNVYHTDDTKFLPKTDRFAIKSENRWSVADFAQIKFRVQEVSDRDYSTDFPEDIPITYTPNLESNVIWNAPFDDFFVSAEASRYRNLLYDSQVGFDGGTVQTEPSMFFGMKERKIAGPIWANFNGRFDDFVRPNGSFTDTAGNGVYNPQTDYIREAKRFILSPEIAAPFKLGGIWSVSPSLQYNYNYYVFNLPGQNNVPDFNTRYVLAKIETSTVLEKVYSYNGDKVNRIQHQLQPFVTYSYIPSIHQDSTHPFSQQILRQGGAFDQYDIIPVSNSSDYLRIPEGNSVYYGFTSRLIRHLRNKDEMPKSYPYDLVQKTPKEYPAPENKKEELAQDREKAWDKYGPLYSDYQDVWDFTASQAYDFKEASHTDDKKRAFSYALARSDLNIDDLSNTVEYRFYPSIVTPTVLSPIPQQLNSIHTLSDTTTWYLKKLSNYRGTRTFIRSLSLSYSETNLPPASRSIGGEVYWSLNDFFAIDYSRSMDLIAHQRLDQTVRTIFSSPSECWQLGFHYRQNIYSGTNFGIDLGLNLFGTGYIGTNQAPPPGATAVSATGGEF